ncbi:hypothetical protein KRR23_21000 [Pseudomonas sp. CVAP|uniref:hypothetical protein n=1 Tax=Pseudomonas sp. CVAP\|nr:hypothetical protein [Pseudomonas sp. CVAP\
MSNIDQVAFSFTAEMTVKGGLEAKFCFKKVYQENTYGDRFGGAATAKLIYQDIDYACINSCDGAYAAKLYFRYVQPNLYNIYVTSLGTGIYLSASSGWLYAVKSGNPCNLILMQNGNICNLDRMTSNTQTIQIQDDSIRKNLQLHDKTPMAMSNHLFWGAITTYGGNGGDTNFTLNIKERGVDWPQ